MPFDLFSLPKEEMRRIEEEYFNVYVDKKGPDDCWLWTGHTRHNGYGGFSKRIGPNKYNWTAHRLAWTFRYNVPIPQGLFCCHSCDVPKCVNPSHIFLGTPKHNTQDAVRKGRMRRPKRKKETNMKKRRRTKTEIILAKANAEKNT